MLLLSGLLACVGGSGNRSGPALDAPEAADRIVAFFALDQEGMREHLPELLEMIETEPDPFLRREIIRQLGYSQDERALVALRTLVASPDRALALESLGYYGPEGCRTVADVWLAASPDPKLELEVERVFRDRSPECAPALLSHCDHEDRVRAILPRACGI